MNKKITVSIIIVVALATAGILWLSSGTPALAPTENIIPPTPNPVSPIQTSATPPTPAPQPAPIPAPKTQPAEAGVTVKNFAFSPADLTVSVGTKVTWTQDDSTPHTIVSNSGVFKSGTLNRGDKFSFTFTEPGTYPYHCGIHASMVGKIIAQ